MVKDYGEGRSVVDVDGGGGDCDCDCDCGCVVGVVGRGVVVAVCKQRRTIALSRYMSYRRVRGQPQVSDVAGLDPSLQVSAWFRAPG